jgi:hypothetical protein
MKIAVTRPICVQRGEYSYTVYQHTKLFDTRCALNEIIDWYKSFSPGKNKFHINDLQFSMVEDENA